MCSESRVVSFLTGIAKQVGDNQELEKLVETLERRHDSYMQDNCRAFAHDGCRRGSPQRRRYRR